MDLDAATCERARLARDARFDGRFFVAVVTTGIYCRPVCPVRAPRSENTRFFATAAAAAEAGFRPCLRCRPETAPGTPAWSGTNATVARGLRLIAEGALDHGSLEEFAARLGLGSRHLNRLFVRHVGASPHAIARTRRLHYAKKLLDETALPMAELAHAAGYGSVRRFNDDFLRCYGTAPTRVRRQASDSLAADGYAISLDYRPPYDWPALLRFLADRATPGVEWVQDNSYARTIDLAGTPGSFTVRPAAGGNRLLCTIHTTRTGSLVPVIEGIKRMFDLGADPREIDCALGADSLLAPALRDAPGLRIPGSWDGFEATVRAIVGQQVSVAAATTTTGRLMARFGERLAPRDGAPAYLFPTPGALADLVPEGAGMPASKALAIRALARAACDGEIRFDRSMEPAELARQLGRIRGIGPWTTGYVAMRFLGDPDAFPHPDLVLLATGRRLLGTDTARALLGHAERWRPWRAYAALTLWRLAAAPARTTR